jgi:hypothetical protein
MSPKASSLLLILQGFHCQDFHLKRSVRGQFGQQLIYGSHRSVLLSALIIRHRYHELRAPISQKINGSAAFFYEDEISEGNLRLSLGLRTRYMNTLSTALTYDGASDYYMYKGVESLGGYPYNDERLTSPKYILDILATAEVDRRAQINILLYNITAEPFYTVSLYPRSGFMFKIDVTWAFLD